MGNKVVVKSSSSCQFEGEGGGRAFPSGLLKDQLHQAPSLTVFISHSIRLLETARDGAAGLLYQVC